MTKTNAVAKESHDLMDAALSSHGLTDTGPIHWNLDVSELIAAALERKEGVLTNTGALSCTTGEHTGRSPKDKFIVRDATTEDRVDWGKVNRPMTPEHFNALRRDQQKYLKGKELFVRDAFGGANKEWQVAIRVINEDAWSNLFCRQLFVRPKEQKITDPQFTIIHTPHFEANPEVHGTASKTFIVVNFTEGLILIGGTRYAGEMKKSIFSILNFLYPLRGVLPMHCSANVSKSDPSNVALFFGLSGTGKTTLSADQNRRLIGDDEHGWNDQGVFNFEGGCYAKCINLTRETEPQIFDAIREGAILENVVLKGNTPDYTDSSLTENTRAAYPLEAIDGAVLEGTGAHPKNIIFLTCDAFGVMPPISRLSIDQARYHFLSGYTAKVAGTEKGMGNTPQTTFSTCFGSPFLPLRPDVYAGLLGKKMAEQGVSCWLVNTGWVGGGVGVGSRIKLRYTRAMVDAAVNGALKNTEFMKESFFGLDVPTSVPGVPNEVLDARGQWSDKAEYDRTASDLARRFVENFQRFEAFAEELKAAGPKL